MLKAKKEFKKYPVYVCNGCDLVYFKDMDTLEREKFIEKLYSKDWKCDYIRGFIFYRRK